MTQLASRPAVPVEALRITQLPHMRLRLHPASYLESRISSVDEAAAIVHYTQVPWHKISRFPEWDGSERWTPRSYARWHEWSYWEVHQSGQFINVLTLAGADDPDWQANVMPTQQIDAPDGVVFWTDILATSVAFTRFAGRFAHHSGPLDDWRCEIGVRNVAGRVLVGDRFKTRIYRQRPVAPEDDLDACELVSADLLLAQPDEVAVRLALHLFRQFGWTDASQSHLLSYTDSSLA